MTQIEVYMDLDTNERPFNMSGRNNGYFYLNELFSDIALVVDGQRFSAHRMVLVQKSDVFMSKFNENPNLSLMRLNGTTPEAVKVFLRYLYHGTYVWNYDLNVVIGTIILAQEFEVNELAMMIAEEVLTLTNNDSFITVNDFERFLKMSEILKSQKLTEKIMAFGTLNMTLILEYEFISFKSSQRIKKMIEALKPTQSQILKALTEDVIALSQHRPEEFQVFIDIEKCSIRELVELFKRRMFVDRDLLALIAAKGEQLEKNSIIDQ